MAGYIKTHEIPSKQHDDIVIASGGVNPDLADAAARSLGLEAASLDLKRHGNDELYSRFRDSVRGKKVYVIQSHASVNGYTTEEAINEHQYIVSAAAGSSAAGVMAIAPYFGHSRGERKSKGREAVPATLIIENFENAGRKTRFSMMSIDLHSPQTAQHLRTGPYEHLTAQPNLREEARRFLGEQIKNCVVVAPDAGAVKNNNRHAEELTADLRQETGDQEIDIDVIFMGKERARDDSTKLSRTRFVYGVEGKICLTFDDMIASGGTMATAAETLKASGAEKVYVFGTHPVFTSETADNLMRKEIDGVFVTDSNPVSEKVRKQLGAKLRIVPIGPLIGRAIYEDFMDGSISKIFRDQNHR
jgi:ribose-phosphate pyrophosphokinase